MKSRLLPLVERAGRFALNRRGFASRTVYTPLAALHAYEASGQGELPTITVLHGIGSGATAFGPTLARLRSHVRRLVALDLLGDGFSAASDITLTPETLFYGLYAVFDQFVGE